MYNLKTFRERIRELYRRSTPYGEGQRPTQRDLAEAVSLDPTELSNRLNGSKGTRLTQRDIRAIVLTLAAWGAIHNQAEAVELLSLLDCPNFTAAEWAVPPLSDLTATPSQPPPLAAAKAAPTNNLPAPLSSFVGRRRELAEVAALLSQTRLLTLVGPGGIGKTRLALELAHQLTSTFTAGVWLVELAPIVEAALLPQLVVKTLGLSEQAGQPLIEMLVESLRDREMLLVLDNCEHLLAEVVALTHQLLTRCPSLRVLTTSRERLNIGGEVVWPVPALSLPDAPVKTSPHSLPRYEAVRLFTERAAAVASGFKLTYANAQFVREICERLDGIPLAVELAAARVSLLSVEQIHARLNDRFRLLTNGARSDLPRQQTLRALIDWSYDLLTDPEQALFSRLAVFVDDFSLEAVEAICGNIGPNEPLDLLSRLVDKSLLVKDEREGVARYAMLETIREYARLLLPAAVGAELQQQHAAFYLSLAEQAEAQLRGEQQAQWLAVLEQEHSNLRAALNWASGVGENELLLRLATRLWRFWYIHGHLSEGYRWLTTALAHTSDDDSRLRAEALNGGANLGWSLGDYPTARRLSEQSLVIYRTLGDRPGIAIALNTLGNVTSTQGDYAPAYTCYEEGLAIKRELNDPQGIAASLNNLGTVAAKLGHYAEAQQLFEESLSLFQEMHNQRGVATLLNNLGDVAADQGHYQPAREFHERSLTMRQELGDRYGIAAVWHSLGNLAYLQRDYAAARTFYNDSLLLRQALSDRYGTVYLLDSLAVLTAAEGQAERAVRLAAVAAALHTRLGAPLPPAEQAKRDQALAAARASLDPAAFDAAWHSSQTLDFNQAVAYAQESLTTASPILHDWTYVH